MSRSVYTRLSGPNQLGGRRTDGRTRSGSSESERERGSERISRCVGRVIEEQRNRERERERSDTVIVLRIQRR